MIDNVTRRRALIAAAAAVALAVGIGVVVGTQGPRLPTVAPAEASVDEGIVVITDAARGHAAMTIGSVVPTTACGAGGHLYTRTANLYVDPGTEDSLIGLIAGDLPAGYDASRANPLGLPVAPLSGNAGPGVTLSVQVISPGWISASTVTDCRSGPAGDTVPSPSVTPPAVIEGYYATLSTRLDSWHVDTLTCPGGAITTISGISVTTDPAALATRLGAAVPPDAQRVSAQGDRIIWYGPDGESTVIAASDDGTHVTVQTTTDTC